VSLGVVFGARLSLSSFFFSSSFFFAECTWTCLGNFNGTGWRRFAAKPTIVTMGATPRLEMIQAARLGLPQRLQNRNRVNLIFREGNVSKCNRNTPTKEVQKRCW
jgi:hypothetical protein